MDIFFFFNFKFSIEHLEIIKNINNPISFFFNNFKQDCIDSVGYKHLKNYSKYVKKFCDCGADYLSKQGKKNQITESDELAAVGFCQDYLRGENAVDAMEKDLRKNLKNIGY